jgi:mannose-1-phosphate guanylyltransferase/mannose-6-phosphate isomerase
VTFGVTPDRPETGYGYLELTAPPEGVAAVRLRASARSPTSPTAEAMRAEGGYLWNAGIFLFRAKPM